MLPHLTLKAKIRNSVSIPQEGRNDVKHVRMILLCVHAFIGEFTGYVGEGSLSERALINLLEEPLEIVTSEHADRAAELWSFDFPALWPMKALKCLEEGKISRWLEHRFPSSPA